MSDSDKYLYSEKTVGWLVRALNQECVDAAKTGAMTMAKDAAELSTAVTVALEFVEDFVDPEPTQPPDPAEHLLARAYRAMSREAWQDGETMDEVRREINYFMFDRHSANWDEKFPRKHPVEGGVR